MILCGVISEERSEMKVLFLIMAVLWVKWCEWSHRTVQKDETPAVQSVNTVLWAPVFICFFLFLPGSCGVCMRLRRSKRFFCFFEVSLKFWNNRDLVVMHEKSFVQRKPTETSWFYIKQNRWIRGRRRSWITDIANIHVISQQIPPLESVCSFTQAKNHK